MTTPNADITLYHKEYDAEKRDYTYTPNQFPGVFWYGGQGVTLSSGGLKASDGYIVRILTDAEISAGADDIVVRGLVSDAVTKAGDLTQKYKGRCFVVTAVRDNRRGSPSMNHWRLEGK